MTLERIGDALPEKLRGQASGLRRTLAQWREVIPALASLDVKEDSVRRAEPLLVHLLQQERVCSRCTGYESCGKLGDEQGMYDHLMEYGGELWSQTAYCEPYLEYQARARLTRYQAFSSRSAYEQTLSFENFPAVQRKRRPQLVSTAEHFADKYQIGEQSKGIYVFGPAGVGKTHLLQAMIKRLEERRIPAILIRAEALFDRLRSVISEGGDIEPVLEAFSLVPVLAIDEIGQERANEFTLEKLFRVINYRFSAKLPTLFASNYAPPDLYQRLATDLMPIIDPLRSRLIGMSRVGDLTGEDHRIASMELLDVQER
ncbi:MAG: ATP-binding protein [Firmicutes bacterium]|nr:ATP-binding protein [Bacillota bacterium]